MTKHTYRGKLAYDGTKYAGWQVQPNQKTIQGLMETAVFKVTGKEVKVLSSGRTDAGVHAHGQVVAFKVDTEHETGVLCRAINAHTPFDIYLRSLEITREDFHPIRDAVSKRYRYIMQPGPIMDPLSLKYAWSHPKAVDLDAMQAAARHFVGKHDFASFEASRSDRKTTVRNVFSLELVEHYRHDARFITIDIRADGFLYNMVRNIVGSLSRVGTGKEHPDWILDVFQARDRKRAGQTAPAEGLYLMDVDYGEKQS
ncbi:MAG: tRNA pseudouridine(38-40) synthase TruA [Planctomycetaceae bacterium]|nr:tRNA pseudouridine(38-40) synthase TruA [Planctomycetaceae bacterium]